MLVRATGRGLHIGFYGSETLLANALKGEVEWGEVREVVALKGCCNFVRADGYFGKAAGVGCEGFTFEKQRYGMNEVSYTAVEVSRTHFLVVFSFKGVDLKC